MTRRRPVADFALIAVGHHYAPIYDAPIYGGQSLDTIRPSTYHRVSVTQRPYGITRTRAACGAVPVHLDFYCVELTIAQAVGRPCRRCYPQEAK